MPADFTYDGSKIVVCNGTEGTPKTFADMHDADLAGTFSLHDRDGVSAIDGSPVAVDNALQPAEQKVLGGAAGQDLYITVENWTNMTAATIQITGTAADGGAQTEDIVVTGNGTSYTTKFFKTITHTQVTVFTKTDAGSFDYELIQGRWGVVWEIIENGFYKIDCDVDIGDDVTSTYFQTKNESIYFADDKMLKCTGTGAHLTFGELVSDVPQNGSRLDIGPVEINNYLSTSVNSTLKLYTSHIHCRTDTKIWIRGNALDIRETVLSMEAGNNYRVFIFINCDSGNLDNVYIVRTLTAMGLQASPTMTNIRTGAATYGLNSAADGVVTVGVKFTDITTYDVRTGSGAYNLTLKDPVTSISTIQINNEAGWVKEQYTCNIHVADKDGANLSGVTVTCKDKDDNQVFSVQTDGNGDIAEQIVDYKKWEGTAEVLTEYSPHKFIFTKAGQRTITISDIAVDHPIVWEIVMSGANRALVGGAA